MTFSKVPRVFLLFFAPIKTEQNSDETKQAKIVSIKMVD